jgi:hypothetical protein
VKSSLWCPELTMFEGCNNVGSLPGEKTLMHLLRDLTAKWGFRSGFELHKGSLMARSARRIVTSPYQEGGRAFGADRKQSAKKRP